MGLKVEKYAGSVVICGKPLRTGLWSLNRLSGNPLDGLNGNRLNGLRVKVRWALQKTVVNHYMGLVVYCLIRVSDIPFDWTYGKQT